MVSRNTENIQINVRANAEQARRSLQGVNNTLDTFAAGIKKLLLPITGLYLANKVLGGIFTDNARRIAFAREEFYALSIACLLYTSASPRD